MFFLNVLIIIMNILHKKKIEYLIYYLRLYFLTFPPGDCRSNNQKKKLNTVLFRIRTLGGKFIILEKGSYVCIVFENHVRLRKSFCLISR